MSRKVRQGRLTRQRNFHDGNSIGKGCPCASHEEGEEGGCAKEWAMHRL